ncbi:MAG: hypothetical protein JWQ76_2392 [Ramlibacter sp.]|nr:hypothetical protein [Ramlibacter sp.]
MNPIPSPGNALRRAALLLHAMAPLDQAWLLESLPPQRRDRLQALLQELRSLGIPADASVLQLAAAAEEVAPPSAMGRLELLNADEVAWLAGRLQEEPPELAVLLLAHQAWAWRTTLLERLDPARRQRVAAAAADPRRPLAEAALFEALARMLPAEIGAPRTSAATRLWNRIRPMHTRGVAAA